MSLFHPMEPTSTQEIDKTGKFLFQIKWDGIRIVADNRSGDLRLYTRKGRMRTETYPELVEELQQLNQTDFLLDGELIALNDKGLPDFQRILKRDLTTRLRRDIPVAYMTFDCLRLSKRDLTKVPLEVRQSTLDALVSNKGFHVVSRCENYDDGDELFRQMDSLGMEGIVAKRRGSLYLPNEKTKLWQKTKCWRDLVVTCLGVKYHEGRPASILAAAPVDGELKEVGFIASGLRADDWKRIVQLQVDTRRHTNGLVPLKDGVFLLIRFLEWTNQGQLRAPRVIKVHIGAG